MTIDINELSQSAQAATPGPWYVGSGTYEGRNIYSTTSVTDGEGFTYQPVVATAEDDDVVCWEANARLIAAAPDLLEALKEIMPFIATVNIGCHGEKCREPWHHSCNSEEEAEAAAQKGCDAWTKASAAIARATGERP